MKALERIADHIENIAKSYIHLIGINKDVQLEDFVKLNSSIVLIFEKSVDALFTRNHVLAEKIFQELKEINEFHSAISNELLQSKGKNIESAILQKTMLDSFGRLGSYSGDIAEIAINMSAGSFDF